MARNKITRSVHFYADVNEVSVWNEDKQKSYEDVTASSRVRLASVALGLMNDGCACMHPSAMGWHLFVRDGEKNGA